MKINFFPVAVLIAVALLQSAPTVNAQQNLWTGSTGNWTDGTWNQFGPPDPTFDAEGIVGSTIGSGSPTGVVNVPTDIRISNPSSTVILGDGNGTSGTLVIGASGGLRVASQGVSTGNFVVGRDGGVGILDMSAGGILEVGGSLSSNNGTSNSSISLGGTATLSAGSATLDRNLTVNGSNVDVSIQGNLVLGLAGIHTWVIPDTGASTVSVGGNADFGGTLKVEFPDGTPAVGSTWNLVDAAMVDGNEVLPSGFSFIDASAVNGLGQGARFATQIVAGSSNGVFGQLVLEQHPVLLVDRDTGEVTLSNPGSAESIAFDSYAVTSNLGSLNPANWSSLDPSGGWLESNPSPTTLSELNPEGTGTVAAATDVSLGAVFAPAAPTSFGVENEDVRFRYSKPSGGFIEGEVVYSGLPNNTLALIVDPTTGNTTLYNPTSYTVAIDNYNIFSNSGALRFADGDPNSTWNSLQDQGASDGNWFEAEPSENRIAELLVEGGLTLAPDAVIDLGGVWNPAGQRDLSLTFAIIDNASGDFNADGVVNLADYTVWRDNLGAMEDGSVLSGNGSGGTVDADDYELWKLNFGSANSGSNPSLINGKVVYEAISLPALQSTLATATVPEPSSVALVALGSIALVTSRKRQLRRDSYAICRHNCT